MDSILNFVGGKHLSCKKIVSLMPDHDCYVEVFAGGLWTFFRKAQSKIEIINDINSSLIGFYRVIQRSPDKFMEREKYEMYSSDLYYEYLYDYYIKKYYNEGMSKEDISFELKLSLEYVIKIISTEFSEVEKAFRFFCLIKEAFSSKFGGGFGFGSVRNNAKAFFNEFKIVDNITKRLKNAVIDNRDFQEVIKSYDNERVLFYLDPPYVASDNDDCYKISFTLHDHQRLYETLSKIKGKFILTIDDCFFVRERYCEGSQGSKGFYWIENEVFYSSADKNNRRHATELIITNYDTNEVIKQNKLKKEKEKQIKLIGGSKSLSDY